MCVGIICQSSSFKKMQCVIRTARFLSNTCVCECFVNVFHLYINYSISVTGIFKYVYDCGSTDHSKGYQVYATFFKDVS